MIPKRYPPKPYSSTDMRRITILSTICILLAAFAGQNATYAQLSTVSLQDAVITSLRNNFSIRLAQDQAIIALNNDQRGAAGLYPTLFIDGGYSGSLTDAHLEFATGGEIDRNNARSRLAQAGVQLDWTLFNGFRFVTTLQRLHSLNRAAELQFRNQVEASTADLINEYYNIVRLQQQERVQLEAIALTRQRLDLARVRYEVGQGNKLDYLQARADMNLDSATLLNLRADLAKAKIEFNKIQGNVEAAADYKVSDTFILLADTTVANAAARAITGNYLLEYFKENVTIARLQLKEAQAFRYPSLALQSRYNFTDQFSQASQVTALQQKGLSAGLTARFNIFQGGVNNILLKNAEINKNSAELSLEQQRQQLLADINKAQTDYVNAREILKLTNDNRAFSRQSLDIAYERYKAGKADLLEYRQAQLSYVEAENRRQDAIYRVKVAETTLLYLSSGLSFAFGAGN